MNFIQIISNIVVNITGSGWTSVAADEPFCHSGTPWAEVRTCCETVPPDREAQTSILRKLRMKMHLSYTREFIVWWECWERQKKIMPLLKKRVIVWYSNLARD